MSIGCSSVVMEMLKSPRRVQSDAGMDADARLECSPPGAMSIGGTLSTGFP